MVFRLDIIPAAFGDCLLLNVGPSKTKLARMLIDGGPQGTAARLIPHLQELGKGEVLRIDHAIVSHIDADHIAGMIQLFEAMQTAAATHAQAPANIELLWHNDFDVLVGEARGAAGQALRRNNGAAALQSLSAVASYLSGFVGSVERHDMAAVLQSYGQGDKLASLANALGVAVNIDACALTEPLSEEKLGDATIKVFGPGQKNLEKLRAGWREFRGDPGPDGAAALAAALRMDGSTANLSSIVVLVEYRGKSILLTGDARGDHIIAALEEAQVLGPEETLEIDIFKLPHHGSIRNIDEATVKRLPARHYVASGDGTYGNPDRATLELLDKYAPRPFSFYMPYPADHVDKTHKAWKESKQKPWKKSTDAISDLIAGWDASEDIKVFMGDGEQPLFISLG